jgi:hypothetical protein
METCTLFKQSSRFTVDPPNASHPQNILSIAKFFFSYGSWLRDTAGSQLCKRLSAAMTPSNPRNRKQKWSCWISRCHWDRGSDPAISLSPRNPNVANYLEYLGESGLGSIGVGNETSEADSACHSRKRLLASIPFKGTVSRDFRPLVFFHQKIPPRPLIHALKYFRIFLRIRRDMNEYVWSRAMSHSAWHFCIEFVCRRYVAWRWTNRSKFWSHSVWLNIYQKFIHRWFS